MKSILVVLLVGLVGLVSVVTAKVGPSDDACGGNQIMALGLRKIG